MEGRDEKINFLGKDFLILRNVFSPKIFPSTKWFSKELSKIIKDARIDFLEMGCGSGMISIFLAIKNKNIRITCVDLNNFSIKNTKLNIKEYELSKKVKSKQK